MGLKTGMEGMFEALRKQMAISQPTKHHRPEVLGAKALFRDTLIVSHLELGG